MKRYCIDCGAPTEYTLKKPIFCSNCGNPFEKNSQVSQPVVQKVQLQKPTIAKKTYLPEVDIEDDQDFDDNEENIANVPQISKIQVETDTVKKDRGIKLKDLMGTDTSSKRQRNKVISKGKKVSKKQILEDFAKEAGSLRKSRR